MPSMWEIRALGEALKMAPAFETVDRAAFEWYEPVRWLEVKIPGWEAKPLKDFTDAEVKQLSEDDRRQYYDARRKWEHASSTLVKRVKRFEEKYNVSPILSVKPEEDRLAVMVGFENEQAQGFKTVYVTYPAWWKDLRLPVRGIEPVPVEFVKVYFKTAVPEFVGYDFQTYGPYKTGEFAYLPKQNVEALIKADAASYELVAPPPPEKKPGEVWDLRAGAASIAFYRGEWTYYGDYAHLPKEDVDHNVRMLQQIWDEFHASVPGSWGVSKDYDPDSVYIFTTKREEDGKRIDGIKVRFWDPETYIAHKGPWRRKAELEKPKWTEEDEAKVIEQIVENCRFWNSNICKTETMLKYARDKGVENPEEVLSDLIRRGVVYEPKSGYVGFTEPEKYGLPLPPEERCARGAFGDFLGCLAAYRQKCPLDLQLACAEKAGATEWVEELRKRLEKPPPPVEVKPPVPPKMPLEEFSKLYYEELNEWIVRSLEGARPGLSGNLHYDAPEYEAETLAKFTKENLLEKYHEEIEKDVETAYGSYTTFAEHEKQLVFITKWLPDRLHGVASNLVTKFSRQLFEEAKEKAAKPPPPPPERPPPAPPKPPVAVPVEMKGLQKADEKRLRTRFEARLGESTVRIERRWTSMFEDRLYDWREAFKDMPRDEALEKGFSEVENIVSQILGLVKPPVRRPPAVAPPMAPPVPAAPEVYVPPAELLGPRTRRVVFRKCWAVGCPEMFEADEDLEQRVRLVPVMKADTPHLGPRYEPLLRFPPLFYFLCPEHREEKFGYRDVYDALAYLYFETESSMAKRLTITKETFRNLGLSIEDMTTIQMRAARWQTE